MEMSARKIDLKKLIFSKKPMSTAESIKDVIPMQWSKKEKEETGQ